MERIVGFVRNNRLPVGIAVGLALLGALAFPYVLGLGSFVAVGLLALVLAAGLGIYRLLQGTAIAWDAPLSGPKLLTAVLAGFVIVGLAIQAVPFGWDRSNPPVTAEPAWDSPRTRDLVVRACFDCHSNEVNYPWYSKIAPMSWAVQLHVQEGRDKVNYSEWDRRQDEADESAETVIDGEMPPNYYTLLAHSEARLTDAEVQDLIAGLKATVGSGEHERDEEDDD